jgi:hypothetical protein
MKRGSWFVPVAIAVAFVATTPIADAQALSPNDDLAALEPGTSVELDHAVVRGKSGNLMRVAHHRREIFVAPVDPSWLEWIAVGAVVDIRGTVREAPSASQARLVYAVDRATAARLARSHILIDAWAVTPT